MNYLCTPRVAPGKEPVFDPMYDLCLQSFRNNLKGDWESRILTTPTPVTVTQKLFEHVVHELHGLTRDGHNVLYVDADTLCVQPVEIFGTTDKMRLFWNTCSQYKSPRPYLNCGVMYLPAAMDGKLWDIAFEALEYGIDTSIWAHDQMIYNDMFWAQKDPPALDPSMNWSPHVENPLPEYAAKILHFHSTRGAGEMLGRMQKKMGMTV